MNFHVDARFVEGKDPGPEMAAEVQRVRELRDAGIIKQLIRRLDDTGAYLVIEAPDDAAVKAALDSLPFSKSGTMTFAVDAVEVL
jgi:muconolactone delta-isomerase